MQASRSYPISSEGLLYPLMWICAVAVVLFSVLGIVVMSGWSQRSPVSDRASVVAQNGRSVVGATAVRKGDNSGSEIEKAFSAFQCAECGVIDTVRHMEASKDMPARPLVPDASSALR